VTTHIQCSHTRPFAEGFALVDRGGQRPAVAQRNRNLAPEMGNFLKLSCSPAELIT